MANFTPPVAELSPIITSVQLQSTNDFSVSVFGNPLVIEGTRKINHTCLALNGVSDYIVVTEPLLSRSPLTVDMWVWFKTITNAEQVIFSQAVSGTSDDCSVYIKNQKLCVFENGTEYVGSSINIPAKRWHHIAFVKDGGSTNCYLNGEAEVTYSSPPAPKRAPIQIGARLGANLLTGMIDAIRFRSEGSWSSSFAPGPTRSTYIADEYYDDVCLLLRGDSFTSDRDSYADKLAFQIDMDHYNNSTFMGPWDDSDNYGSTFVGNAKIVSSHFKNNYPSISFDGINDAIVVTNSPSITFGTTFTLEFWMYVSSYALKMTLFDKREATTLTGLLIYTDTDTKLYAKFGDSTAGWDVELASGTLSVGWHHVVIVRNASDTNSWKLFVDGTQSGSTVNSAITVAENSDLLIGRTRANTEYFSGQLSEIQLTQNTAKYTSSVVIPTAPVPDPINLEYDYTSLLLHFDGNDGSNDFVDSSKWNHTVAGLMGAKISTTQSKFGSSSLYLSGTANCGVVIQPHDSMNIGEGDFTVECWIRIDATGTTRYFLGTWLNSLTQGIGQLLIGVSSSGNRVVAYWYPYSTTVAILTGTVTAISANTWYHVAVTRKNDWWTLWTNGAIDAQSFYAPRNFRNGTTFKTDQWKTYGFTMGDFYESTFRYGTNIADWAGYIDEVRVVKGKAIYTEPFTPPTAAFTLSTNYPYRDSNVKLFLDVNQDYLIKDKSIGCNALTYEGSIIAGKPIGGSYAVFDGAGDAIRFATIMPGDVAVGLEDFTVEAWVYPINGGWVSQANGRIVETEQSATAGGFCMYMVNPGNTNPSKVGFFDSRTSGFEFSLDTVANISNATWSHVAFTRENGLLISYINGVPKAVTFGNVTWDADRLGSRTLSNNNKTATLTASSSCISKPAFNSQSSTGVYWEVVLGGTLTSLSFGVYKDDTWAVSNYPGQTVTSWGLRISDGYKVTGGSHTAYGVSAIAGDVIMVAVKNGKIWFGKNGTWMASGNPGTDTNAAFTNLTGYISCGWWSSNVGASVVLRDGISDFSYAIPNGFAPIKEASLHYFSKTRVSIGANNSALESFYGNIDDVRFTRGVSRYALTWAEKSLTGDAYSANVMLLLNCNGTDGGTTFTDSSSSGKTVTVNSSVTTVTGTKRFGTASAQFDGTSGYLSLDDSDDWNFGSSDFTIEMWYKFRNPPHTAYTGAGGQYIYSQYLDSNNYVFIAFGSTNIVFESKNVGSTIVTMSNTVTHDSGWHHLAITRASSTVTMYRDGVSIGTASISGSMPNIASTLQIGRLTTGSAYFKGWLDDIRITKGTSRYPAEFSYAKPPTGLLPVSRKKIQEFPGTATIPYSVRTLRGAGAKFDIAADLTLPHYNNSNESKAQWEIQPNYLAIVPSYSDFTLEGWFYPTVSGSGYYVLTKNTGASDGIAIGVSTTRVTFRYPYLTDLIATVSLTGWNHIVWQKRGDLKQIFVNGVKVGEITQASFYFETWAALNFGATYGTGTGTRYIGYIDGFRFTRGVARYLADFTPPTTQFPTKFVSFPNTLLSCFFTDPQVLPNSVKLVGNPRTVKPSGITESGACWFDGDDDFIQLLPGSAISYENFTLEFWVEVHQYGSVSKPIYIWSQGSSLAQTDKAAFALVSSDLKWVYGTTFTNLDTIPLYTWTHIAMTRENGVLRIFMNGVKKYEGNVSYFGTGTPCLGLVSDETISSAEFRFRGFISNFRILKNVVLYTANFTPSTTLSIQAQNNTAPLVDPGNDLILGNFTGSLDEVTIMDGATSDSMIRFIEEEAFASPPPVPRVEITDTMCDKMEHTISGQWYGPGKIWGTVTDAQGQPMSRKIVLIEYWSFMPLYEVMSDPITGYYEFTNLAVEPLFSVVAVDYQDYRFNDIIRAKVHAEVV